MRTSITCLLALVVLSAGQTFVEVPLEDPDDWISGPSLFPGNMIAGYNGELTGYQPASWLEHIREECESFADCTSYIAFQADNSGSTGGRYWFGYVFRGGPTTPADYVRAISGAVTYSTAWTVESTTP